MVTQILLLVGVFDVVTFSKIGLNMNKHFQRCEFKAIYSILKRGYFFKQSIFNRKLNVCP